MFAHLHYLQWIQAIPSDPISLSLLVKHKSLYIIEIYVRTNSIIFMVLAFQERSNKSAFATTYNTSPNKRKIKRARERDNAM